MGNDLLRLNTFMKLHICGDNTPSVNCILKSVVVTQRLYGIYLQIQDLN